MVLSGDKATREAPGAADLVENAIGEGELLGIRGETGDSEAGALACENRVGDDGLIGTFCELACSDCAREWHGGLNAGVGKLPACADVFTEGEACFDEIAVPVIFECLSSAMKGGSPSIMSSKINALSP